MVMLTQAQAESSSAILRHTEEDRKEWQDMGLLPNSPPAPFAQTEAVLLSGEKARH